MPKKIKNTLIFTVLILLLLFSIGINITNGSVDLSLSQLAKIGLGQRELTKLEYNVLFKIRIPRIIAAILFGGALSISGFLLQIFFKNSIVGPYVLGISS